MKTDYIINQDCLSALKTLPENSVDCCVTSPPYYGLRDYGISDQIGQEASPAAYIAHLVAAFHELYRVLKPCGTLWINIADTYCGTGSKGAFQDPKNPRGRNGQRVSINSRVDGCKFKDLIGIPWMLAFALRDDGWYLRSDIIWHKNNPMPESVKDRPTRSYEHIFLLTKSRRYYYDASAIAEPASSPAWKRCEAESPASSDYNPPMRNKRDVWQINTVPYKGGHYAAFPPKLAETCILAGCPEHGIVLDPFFGTGTTGFVAKQIHRQYIGIELNPDYCELARERIGA